MTDQVEVFEPAYVRQFQCIGDRCEDHCCHSWEVTLDKKSYKTLRKNRNPVLVPLVASNISLRQQNEQQFAAIKISAHANCPFLNEQRLCEIQRLCGHAALPRTCRNYPRSNSLIAGRVEKSLSLSCPEAARQILLNPDAMLIEQYAARHTTIAPDIHNHFADEQANAWLPVVRQFCFDTILDPGLSCEQQLFQIGLFLRQAEPQRHDPEALDRLGVALRAPDTQQQLGQSFAALSPSPALLWNVFSTVANGIIGQQQLKNLIAGGASISDRRFLALHQAVAAAVANASDNVEPVAQAEQAMARLQQGYTGRYLPFFAEHGHILRNYLLYQVYHYLFPLHASLAPFDCFRLLVIDFFMLRAYLCGLALARGALSEALVIELVQSWSRKRQHAARFEQELGAMLESAGAADPAAVFALLKFAPASDARSD